MIEKVTYRNGERIVEVRSDGGKLMYVKTKDGYEMKCPRTKQLCVVNYDRMLFDCLECLSGVSDEVLLKKKADQIQQILNTSP